MEMRQRQCRCCNRNSNLMDLDNYILVNIFSRLPVKSVCCIGCVSKTLSNIVDLLFAKQQMRFLIATNAASKVPQLMVVAQSRNKCTEKLMALQSLQYDGNSLEKSRYTIVSQVLFRRHKYSFHLDFVFFNIIGLKDGTDGRRCLLLNPPKGEAMMLPTMLPSIQVPENLNPKSFEYWYSMGFVNTTNTYKIVRVYGCKTDGIFGTLFRVFGFSCLCFGNKLMEGHKEVGVQRQPRGLPRSSHP